MKSTLTVLCLLCTGLTFRPLPPVSVVPFYEFAPLIEIPSPLRMIEHTDPPVLDARRCTAAEWRGCTEACNSTGQQPLSCSVGTDPVSRKMTLSCSCWIAELHT